MSDRGPRFRRPHGRLIVRLVGGAHAWLARGPREWCDLDHATRRDVLHHARQGRPYPDPKVAAVAVGWARWMLSAPPPGRWLRAALLAVVLQIVGGIALGTVALVLVVVLHFGTIGVEHGYLWIVRSLWGLAGLTLMLGMWPWWDAKRVLRLNGPPSRPQH